MEKAQCNFEIRTSQVVAACGSKCKS